MSAPTTKKDTNKKSVHFAPLTSMCRIEYIPIPSPSTIPQLYYSDEEEASSLDQMIYDVLEMEAGTKESEEFTRCGLEKRTEEGHAQIIASRNGVWNAVMNEQLRQWDVLAWGESCDEQLIAQACIEVSKEAGERAHLLALRDQEDVHGYEMEGERDDDSMATMATASLSCSSIETQWEGGSSKPSCRKQTPRRYNKLFERVTVSAITA